jgi:hypothetical protein
MSVKSLTKVRPERTDEIDGVADALLPLARDLHGGLAVGHDLVETF